MNHYKLGFLHSTPPFFSATNLNNLVHNISAKASQIISKLSKILSVGMIKYFKYDPIIQTFSQGRKPKSLLNGHFDPQGASLAYNLFFKGSFNFDRDQLCFQYFLYVPFCWPKATKLYNCNFVRKKCHQEKMSLTNYPSILISNNFVFRLFYGSFLVVQGSKAF